ncbi:MAG: hypothetical protein P4L87_25060 [Formivibrio sp.]|nr:hypothetical protein [Formivibrio sp.]
MNQETTITLPTTSIAKQTLAAGELYAGIILGKDGAADYHLILIPGEVEDVNWQTAMDWAAEQGGELPTRREQSLLFTNLKERFKPSWYWSGEEYPNYSPYAFVQNFDYGDQDFHDKGNEYCARAVRRVSVIE